MTGNDGRSLPLDLSFLEPGASYTARIFTDDPAVKTATQVRCTTRRVDSKTLMTLDLLPRGGAAMIITKD